MQKLRVVAVSYLNTKPLLYGLLRSPIAERIDLQLAIPSECARRLRDGEADLGLAPVAILPELDNWQLVSNYCIGATGPVKTVCLYGEVPIERMEAIYLDHHSRTSVALIKILLRHHWRLSPQLLPAQTGYIQQIGGTTGGLVIGDRTIGLEEKFPYVYDLGHAWREMTNLPFVFAAWVSVKPLDEDFIAAFDAALGSGLTYLPDLKYLLSSPHPNFDLEYYFTHCISYELDEEKQKGLATFLQYLEAYEYHGPVAVDA